MLRASSLLLCAGLFTGCTAVEEVGDYFLLEVGNTWTYALIQGGNDEEWTLEVLDAAENDQSPRGDLWVLMTYPEPANDPQNPGAIIERRWRSFNVSLEADSTGEEPIPIGYTYRYVLPDEGDRSEFFVKYPGDNDAYTESWDYEVEEEGTTTRFEYEVSTQYSTEPVDTGYGKWSDNVLVDRVVTQHREGEDPFVQRHHEVWAAGGGLVRYRFVSVDEVVTEVVVRDSSAYATD